MLSIVGKSSTLIQNSNYNLRYLGGKFRTFKPGAPFEVYVSFVNCK